jgi:hypothetical protein
MKIKLFLIAVLLVGLVSAGSAQTFSAITYDVTLPSGPNTSDFVSNSLSWRGIGLDFRKFTSEKVSVGLSFAWHVMNYETAELINLERDELGLDVAGKHFRYVNSFPLMASLHYYPTRGNRAVFLPYVGANAGAYSINQRLELGLIALEKTSWHLGFAPEVGFAFGLGEANILVNARYNYALSATGITGEKLDWGYFSFNVGFAWQTGYY